MSVLPLAEFLRRFEDAKRPSPPPAMDESEPVFEGPAVQQEDPLEAARLEAFEEGKKAGESLMERSFQEAQEAFEAQIESERKLWMDDIAAQLIARLDTAVQDLGDAVGRNLLTILEPFLATMLRQKAIEEAIVSLSRLMESDTHALMRVSGPADFIDRIKSSFPGRLGAVEFVPTGDLDVTCVARDTIIETRLRDWASTLNFPQGSA